MVALFHDTEIPPAPNHAIRFMKPLARNIARGYQRQYLEKALQGNVIVCLETGSGKTLIAILLLEALSSSFPVSELKVAVFLVPTVSLVQQQGNAIEILSDLQVGQYSGQTDGGSWEPAQWEQCILQFEVLVMTPQILLNLLRHGFIKVESIKVLIFDECHHCQKGHPYARIMEEYYFPLSAPSRPKIFGMTASPIIRKGNSEAQYHEYIKSLEEMLDAKIVSLESLEDRTELEAGIPRPMIEVREFSRDYSLLSELELHAQALQNLKGRYCRQELSSRRNKELSICERACRSVEYCMYELGLWFARHAARTLLTSGGGRVDQVEESNDVPKNKTKVLLLKDICQYLDQVLNQVSLKDVKDLVVNSSSPNLVMNKVATLIDVLSSFRNQNLKCIVFVERIIVAEVLSDFLNQALNYIRCKCIIGSQQGFPSKGKAMSKTLEEFRNGEVNVLVATSVAEEGLDIQSCHLVIQFDMPKTIRSFIQSRGRARAPGSHYVILKERGNSGEREVLANLFETEALQKAHISFRNDTVTHLEHRKDNDLHSFQVQSTGATVNLSSSVQLLHQFCSKLPKDQLGQTVPEFFYHAEAEGIICEVLFPATSPVRRVVGEVCESKSTAKKVACLKACTILHSKGALTDFLLPSPLPGSMDRQVNPAQKKKTSAGSKADIQETITPALLVKPHIDINPLRLHVYMFLFDPVPPDRRFVEFVLLVQSSLPASVCSLCLDLEMAHRKKVKCQVVPCGELWLDRLQVTKAEIFQSRLFSIMLDRDLRHPCMEDWFAAYSGWYLLLPCVMNEEGGAHCDANIDWEAIEKVALTEDLIQARHALCASYSGRSDGALKFANGLIDLKEARGVLVRTVHGNSLYCIVDVFTDLNGYSKFPSSTYESYVHYFKEVYDYEISTPEQPLLKAKPLRQVHNLLQARFSRKGGIFVPSATEEMLVELPPELCSIEVYGLHDALINSAALLPSLMHRIESILLAAQLRDYFGSMFPQGSIVSTEKVLEALTTQKCTEAFSLERLELLGDSFLKYAVSCHLFAAHVDADEGFLSSQRNLRICNSSLCNIGISHGLPGFILDGLFRPENWVAPCHRSKVICNGTEHVEAYGEILESNENEMCFNCNRKHRWMQRKTVADTVEALIGAYLVDGEHDAALEFMASIGLDVFVDPLSIKRLQSSSKINLHLMEKINVKEVETVLSYKFKHKGLLIEAFMHASFKGNNEAFTIAPLKGNSRRCYQRLEFLGDSVLDYLITRYLYKEFTNLKPGQLTDLRSSVVNNDSFARVAIQYKLYVYLLHGSVELSNQINQFINYLQKLSGNSSGIELPGVWEGDKCPKVLGDLVESLAGAVFVDAGFDIHIVWSVFEPILQPVVTMKTSQLHPVRELIELCQRHHFELTYDVVREDRCEIQYHVSVCDEEIGCSSGKKKEVTGSGKAKDKKSAKRQAAYSTLNKLKELGYVHRSKSPPKKLQKSYRQLPASSTESGLKETSEKGSGSPVDKLAECLSLKVLTMDGTTEKKSSTGIPTPCSDGTTVSPRWINELTAESANDRIHEEEVSLESSAYDMQKKAAPDASLSEHVPDVRNAIIDSFLLQILSEENPSVSSDISFSSDKAATASEQKNGSNKGSNQTDNSSMSSCEQAGSAAFSNVTKACTKGQARKGLYEVCAKYKWKEPLFRCCQEDGMPHRPMFTYDVIVEIPSIGQIQCTGDPQRTKKEAMDSSASELLQWLEGEGLISSWVQ